MYLDRACCIYVDRDDAFVLLRLTRCVVLLYIRKQNRNTDRKYTKLRIYFTYLFHTIHTSFIISLQLISEKSFLFILFVFILRFVDNSSYYH